MRRIEKKEKFRENIILPINIILTIVISLPFIFIAYKLKDFKIELDNVVKYAYKIEYIVRNSGVFLLMAITVIVFLSITYLSYTLRLKKSAIEDITNLLNIIDYIYNRLDSIEENMYIEKLKIDCIRNEERLKDLIYFKKLNDMWWGIDEVSREMELIDDIVCKLEEGIN